MNRRIPQSEKRAGVALIVVLGFLSLMMVMAVAFLSTARTEEEVSDYSQEAIRCRQILRSGLAAAMNDYSRELWKQKLYLPNADYEVFPSESSGIDAISGSGKTLKGSQTTLLRGEALDWIPSRYRTNEVTNDVNNAEWILVREDPGSSSRIIGRYAYVCFDCSGALDGNFVALDDGVANDDARAMTNRLRRSIRSVPMALLPEIAQGGDASEFKSYRKGWKGFDSPQMLLKLTDGKPQDGNGSSARWQLERKETHGPGLASNYVSEVTSYSLSAYRGGRYSRTSGTWEQPKYIDPETGNGWRAAFSPILSQLTGVSESDFEKMIRDFTSSKKAPEGVNYPSVKNVPMFNEVIIRNIKLNSPTKGYVSVDGIQQETWEYSAKAEIQFEFWYPFPSEDNEIGAPFVLKAPTLSMQSQPGAATFKILAALKSPSGQFIRVLGEATPDKERLEVPAKWNGGKPYVTEAFSYTVKFKDVNGKPIDSDECPLVLIQQIEVGADLDLTLGTGDAVDRLPKGLVQRIPMITIMKGQTCDKSFSWECLDPRLNHLTADWETALTDGGTPGDVNECTEKYQDYVLEGSAMYCRNKPLETPADFGFFSIGKPWKTIDLLGDAGAKFLALSTMDDNIRQALDKNGVFYTNAQLNINTRCSNALASAFYMLSTMEVPGWKAEDHEGVDAFEEEDARELAARIMEDTKSATYQSAMDWAASPVMQHNGWLQSKGLNRNQREALLRNTYGLFSVADSLFLAVVVAQSVKEGEGKVGTWDSEDQVTGERRGIALVWRDPFKTGTNAHHEMMVRMFRYLND